MNEGLEFMCLIFLVLGGWLSVVIIPFIVISFPFFTIPIIAMLVIGTELYFWLLSDEEPSKRTGKIGTVLSEKFWGLFFTASILTWGILVCIAAMNIIPWFKENWQALVWWTSVTIAVIAGIGAYLYLNSLKYRNCKTEEEKPTPKPKKKRKQCHIPSCDRKLHCKGMCQKHYQQNYWKKKKAKEASK